MKKRFLTNRALLFAYVLASVVNGIVGAWLLRLSDIIAVSAIDENGKKIYNELYNEQMFVASGVIFSLSIIFLAVPKIWEMLNIAVYQTIEGFWENRDKSDQEFSTRVSEHFGKALVENIMSYELFCKKEYQLDLQRHHFSWVLLSVSGVITILAGLIMLYLLQNGELSAAGAESSKTLIAAIATGLPALVTGILVKIWLETGTNLQRSRLRAEQLSRQRIRMLLLIGNRTVEQLRDLSGVVADSNLVLQYLRIGKESLPVAAVPEPPTPDVPPTPPS